MVQIIKENPKPTFLDRLGEVLGPSLQAFTNSAFEGYRGGKEREQLGNLIGQDVSNIRNQQFLSQLLGSGLTEQRQNKMMENEFSEGLMDYETIKKFAGEDVADFYKASPIGGKTKIVQSIIDSFQRGENLGEVLHGGLSPKVEETPRANLNEISKEKNGKLDLPDYTQRPKGTTAKSWEDTRKGWTKSNVENLDKSRDRIKSNKRDFLGTKKLQNINESHELPEGIERLIINPKTGEPYKLAQLSEKTPTAIQEWVKEISRFGNRAKDAYGSRVTNFDLLQYMKQFPSLLNTYEGRRNILRMMEINYELDSLYDKEVQRIIDQKGAGNIPPEEVDRIARGLIKDKEEELFNEYLSRESENDNLFISKDSKPSLEEIFG